MSKWFGVLKIQETITDIGIDFDLPEKVESKDKKDKFPCCEEARKRTLQIINFREKDFVKKANCEDLYWKINYLARIPWSRSRRIERDEFKEIEDDWGECAISSTPSEQKGWHTDYRDVE